MNSSFPRKIPRKFKFTNNKSMLKKEKIKGILLKFQREVNHFLLQLHFKYCFKQSSIAQLESLLTNGTEEQRKEIKLISFIQKVFQ